MVKNGTGILVFNNTAGNFGGISSITVDAGTVQLDNNSEIPAAATIYVAGGALGFGYDGTTTGLLTSGTGSVQTDGTPFTQNATFTANGILAVGRIGLGVIPPGGTIPLFQTATNKTVQYNGTITFANGVNSLTINNNNGDSLEILSTARMKEREHGGRCIGK